MAIIGRGDIAKAIHDRRGFTFYCNGLSNREPHTRKGERKEYLEILSMNKGTMFVYISTLSIYYSNSPYTKHKSQMEETVKLHFPNYCILRIGNITWGDNPNTIINKFKSLDSPPELKDEHRYLLSKNEFNHWIKMIPHQGQHQMNITGQRITVQKLWDICR